MPYIMVRVSVQEKVKVRTDAIIDGVTVTAKVRLALDLPPALPPGRRKGAKGKPRQRTVDGEPAVSPPSQLKHPQTQAQQQETPNPKVGRNGLPLCPKCVRLGPNPRCLCQDSPKASKAKA